MGAPFQKVQQGEPIQHLVVEHNAFIDTAVAHKANQYGFEYQKWRRRLQWAFRLRLQQRGGSQRRSRL